MAIFKIVPPAPKHTLAQRVWSWQTVGVVAGILAGGGFSCMSFPNAFIADTFFTLAAVLFLVKFLTWDDASEGSKKRRVIIGLAGACAALTVWSGAVALNHYIVHRQSRSIESAKIDSPPTSPQKGQIDLRNSTAPQTAQTDESAAQVQPSGIEPKPKPLHKSKASQLQFVQYHDLNKEQCETIYPFALKFAAEHSGDHDMYQGIAYWAATFVPWINERLAEIGQKFRLAEPDSTGNAVVRVTGGGFNITMKHTRADGVANGIVANTDPASNSTITTDDFAMKNTSPTQGYIRIRCFGDIKPPSLPIVDSPRPGIVLGSGNEVSDVTVVCASIMAQDNNKLSHATVDNRCTPQALHEVYDEKLRERKE